MDNYNERLKHLTKEVNQITSNDGGGGFASFLPKNINYKLVGIISLPIIILLVLIFTKSSIIMKSNKDKTKKSLSYIKLFIILGIIVMGELAFYFFYLRKKNNIEIMP